MVFIKKNKFILAIILGIVSMSLMIPQIAEGINTIKRYADIGGDIPALTYFILAEYICIFFAEVVFIIIGARRTFDPYLIMASATLYYASKAAYNIYNVIYFQDYSSVYSIVVEILALALTILAITRPRFFFYAFILLLVDSAFCLSSTFTGSTAGLSTLILTVMLIFAVYISCTNRNIDEVDYDQYS